MSVLFRTFCLAIVACCGVLTSVASAAPSGHADADSRAGGTFLVFDALHYKNKPNLSRYGLRPIHIIYEGSFWPSSDSGERVRENAVRVLARQAAATGDLVCIDIERWIPGLKESDAAAARSIGKYAGVADWMHHTEPGLRLGFYAVPPIRDYWSVMSGGAKLTAWHRQNERLEDLTKHVDVIFPSLYTFYDDREGWVKYAKANLRQARRYGKPVYAFLMPVYHNSNDELGGQPIPGDYWKLELETCRQYADGIVIWSGPGKPWNQKASWWQATKSFLSDLDQ